MIRIKKRVKSRTDDVYSDLMQRDCRHVLKSKNIILCKIMNVNKRTIFLFYVVFLIPYREFSRESLVEMIIKHRHISCLNYFSNVILINVAEEVFI